jgi:hypothetical protein
MTKLSLKGAGAAVLAALSLFAAGVPDDKLVAWVENRVRELQPTRAERRIDEVGWAAGILEAERLGRNLHRPVFLFTYDGRINTGRC